jgi:ABC-type Fe3+-hydroxamate transport system substrate-binding protein
MGPVAVGRVASLATAALLLALVLAACGERSEPTGANAAGLYPVTVASPTGRPALVVRKPAQRIAVLNGNMQPLLVALGAGGRIVGTPVARNGDLKTTQLRRLRPDLLVATSSSDDDPIVSQAAKLVPHALVYPADVDSIDGTKQTLTDLGVITGEPGNASRLVRDIAAKQALVRRRLAHAQRVSVYVDRGNSLDVTNQSLPGDMLSVVKATNVAGNVDQIDPAQLLQDDPDWYLATSASGVTLKELRHDPKKRKLRAVRLGHFATIDSAQISPGPDIGKGLLALAMTLHPDAFH